MTVAEQVRQLGGTAQVYVSDLGAPGSASLLATRLEEQGEAVDVLINNAGYGIVGPFLDASTEDAEGMGMLNAVGLTGLTHQLVPGMVERGRGGVLNVGSVASFVPAPRFAVYGATKAYVLSFTDALHAELAGTGVHVSCLCPGPVRTSFADRAGMDDKFFSGAMSADRVAASGLYGLARNQRRVVPGWTNKVQAFASSFVPSALTLRVTEAVMRRAG